jgi:hypothetical protein
MVGEKMQQMEQWSSNYGWWWRGDNGADYNNNKKINKWVVAEAEDNNSWLEVGCHGGGGGATVVQWWRRSSSSIRSWRMEVEDWRGSFLPRPKKVLKTFIALRNVY